MSDYKRFVAYLYEYHENSKGENRGFVRVEARSGTCQMAFQLKVISLPEGTPLNVYGFVRIREFLFGIPVGILRAGKGGISGRLLAPSVHMGDSSFSLDDLSGLLITGPEGRVYATQWDDIPILPDHFTTDASILQAPREEEEETQEIPPENPEPDGVQIASLDLSPAETQVSPLPADPLPAPALLPDRWEALRRRHTSFCPFDDEEICDCIRLSLKDLPELRKDGWQISSSQFLLHAFYNYRHFLMGRCPGLDNACILGVPGVFDIREQFMAGMFGFSAFKPARSETGVMGNAPFGYCYRQVQ